MSVLNQIDQKEHAVNTNVPCFLCSQGSDISPSQYHETIVWLREMSGLFQFSSETFALGVCVLNSLLAAVKVSETDTTFYTTRNDVGRRIEVLSLCRLS